MGWLFGALGSAGITMPKSLDFKGILDLVLQIKDKLGNLEEMVIEPIKSFVIEKIVKSGIMWIVSLLNPASAFIKACKAIYDIIMFVVERGAEMMEFVNAIIDSIGAVAKGGIGAMVSKIEGVLSKALPLAISFLASLLGLGGISEKIRSIIDTVRAPINKAIDFVIGGAVKAFKKMFKGAIGWVKGKYEKGKAFVKDKVDKGKKYVKGKVDAGKKWVRSKVDSGKDWAKDKAADARAWLRKKLGLKVSTPARVGSESHTLSALIDSEDSIQIIMASTPEKLVVKLQRAHDVASDEEKPKIKLLIDQVPVLIADIAALTASEKQALVARVDSGQARGFSEELRRSEKFIERLAMRELAMMAGKLGVLPALEKVRASRLAKVKKDLVTERKLLQTHEEKIEEDRQNPLFRKGPTADDAKSLPTSSPVVTPDQRLKIQSLGPCHHKGLPGCADAPPYTPDHQPPSELMTILYKGKPLIDVQTQRVYPQCRAHSNQQGASVKNLRKRIAEHKSTLDRISLLEDEERTWENK